MKIYVICYTENYDGELVFCNEDSGLTPIEVISKKRRIIKDVVYEKQIGFDMEGKPLYEKSYHKKYEEQPFYYGYILNDLQEVPKFLKDEVALISYSDLKVVDQREEDIVWEARC